MSDPPTPHKTIPPQRVSQDPAVTDSVNTNSADLEATASVTDEDSGVSETECSDEEENELGPEELSYLCKRCLRIDVDSIFSPKVLEEGGDPILWFSKQKVLADPQCAFCQAMRFIHPSLDVLPEWKKQITPLVVARIRDEDTIHTWKSRTEVTGERLCLTFGYHDQTRILALSPRYWTKKNVESRNSERLDYHLSREWVGYLAEKPTIESDKSALPAASIQPRVNFGMIKARLKECREKHKECASKRGGSAQRIPGLRLIDCRTRTVVSAPEGDFSYAALSYVWGNSGNRGNFEDGQNHKLPDKLPNTISDAILVTRKLGIRYIWIDRYCIRQDPRTKEEKDEKHGQIARMHQIYGSSLITIIAAAGDGPHHGLPGVRTKRRSPTVRLPGRTLFATLPDPKLLVDASAWSKRGWTFQEGLLAKRRLVFTHQQIYFQCGEIGNAEAWEECHSQDMLKGFDLNEIMPLYPYFALGNRRSLSIWPRIDDYVKLTLGDPQDILNGILGVLTLHERLSSARHVAGLPVTPWTGPPISWAEEVADALSWECNDPGEQRAGFPTWSWTGWTCKGLKRNNKFNRIPPERVRAWSISIERPKDESADQNDLVALLEGRHDLSQVMVLRVTASFLEAEIIPMDKIPDDQCYWTIGHMWKDGFDNNKKLIGVRYSGVEKVSFVNLIDYNVVDLLLSCGKIRCSAIIVDEDRLDIPDDQLGRNGYDLQVAKDYATALLVVEKENGFEKVGVSGIARQTLRRIGSVAGEFRLI